MDILLLNRDAEAVITYVNIHYSHLFDGIVVPHVIINYNTK